jgi:hypothetical protein
MISGVWCWPNRSARSCLGRFTRRRNTDFPVQEIIETAPGINLALACNAVEDAEMRARPPVLRSSVDRAALWASEDYGGLLRRTVHSWSVRPEWALASARTLLTLVLSGVAFGA